MEDRDVETPLNVDAKEWVPHSGAVEKAGDESCLRPGSTLPVKRGKGRQPPKGGENSKGPRQRSGRGSGRKLVSRGREIMHRVDGLGWETGDDRGNNGFHAEYPGMYPLRTLDVLDDRDLGRPDKPLRGRGAKIARGRGRGYRGRKGPHVLGPMGSMVNGMEPGYMDHHMNDDGLRSVHTRGTSMWHGQQQHQQQQFLLPVHDGGLSGPIEQFSPLRRFDPPSGPGEANLGMVPLHPFPECSVGAPMRQVTMDFPPYGSGNSERREAWVDPEGSMYAERRGVELNEPIAERKNSLIKNDPWLRHAVASPESMSEDDESPSFKQGTDAQSSSQNQNETPVLPRLRVVEVSLSGLGSVVSPSTVTSSRRAALDFAASSPTRNESTDSLSNTRQTGGNEDAENSKWDSQGGLSWGPDSDRKWGGDLSVFPNTDNVPQCEPPGAPDGLGLSLMRLEGATEENVSRLAAEAVSSPDSPTPNTRQLTAEQDTVSPKTPRQSDGSESRGSGASSPERKTTSANESSTGLSPSTYSKFTARKKASRSRDKGASSLGISGAISGEETVGRGLSNLSGSPRAVCTGDREDKASSSGSVSALTGGRASRSGKRGDRSDSTRGRRKGAASDREKKKSNVESRGSNSSGRSSGNGSTSPSMTNVAAAPPPPAPSSYADMLKKGIKNGQSLPRAPHPYVQTRLGPLKADDTDADLVQGLGLFSNILTVEEEKRLIEYTDGLVRMGFAGHFAGETFCAPRKWTKGNGRIVIQFGMLYDSHARRVQLKGKVCRMPKDIEGLIDLLVRRGMIEPGKRPDSCTVHIYNEGDALPPPAQNGPSAFPIPSYTLSLLSEATLLLGKNISNQNGVYTAPLSVVLPRRSFLIMESNSISVAKHCISPVQEKRISYTFRVIPPKLKPSVQLV
eukprot:Rmarinus@m.11902